MSFQEERGEAPGWGSAVTCLAGLVNYLPYLLQTLLPCTAQSTVTKWLYRGPGRLREGNGSGSQGGLPLGRKNRKWRWLGGFPLPLGQRTLGNRDTLKRLLGIALNSDFFKTLISLYIIFGLFLCWISSCWAFFCLSPLLPVHFTDETN